jgi:ubiquinone/menaquinone biosynthesis C-methylase UbiE
MNLTDQNDFDRATGELFGSLWGPYDQQLFDESVALFHRRLDLVGFDKEYFRGKVVLDAGCGGGRNTVAMAQLGAAEAHGIDISAKGLENAALRAAAFPEARFLQASVEEIPYPDRTFDAVWCAGVLMHTGHDEKVLAELARVIKPGGLLYMLVYATGGLRWPLIQLVRPIAAQIGQDRIEEAVERSGIPANKRRTFLDDLFVPKLDFFRWDRLRQMLERHGFGKIERWGPEARLDHEHSLAAYREDLEFLDKLFTAGCDPQFGGAAPLFSMAASLTEATIDLIGWYEDEVAAGRIPVDEAMQRVIGQGHHRLFATMSA